MRWDRIGLWAFGATLGLCGGVGVAAEGPGGGDIDAIVVTGRLANASINGIAIEPLLLPQNVRVLDRSLIENLGAQRLDDLLDLSGSVSRQNNFGGLWDNPGYEVANVGASVRLWRQVAVYGRVQNLFDSAYEDALGYPSPGRIGYVGVRVAAGR